MNCTSCCVVGGQIMLCLNVDLNVLNLCKPTIYSFLVLSANAQLNSVRDLCRRSAGEKLSVPLWDVCLPLGMTLGILTTAAERENQL